MAVKLTQQQIDNIVDQIVTIMQNQTIDLESAFKIARTLTIRIQAIANNAGVN